MEKYQQTVKQSNKKSWQKWLLISSSVLAFNLFALAETQSVGAQEADKAAQVNEAEKSENPRALGAITAIEKGAKNFVVTYATGEKAQVSIMNDHVFRYHLDPSGAFSEYPTPNDPKHVAKMTAKSMDDYGLEAFQQTTLTENDQQYVLENAGLKITFTKENALLSVFDKKRNQIVMAETAPISFANNKVTQTVKQENNEYYFGGGTQNGRFTHKGTAIQIVNTNNWVDGGVASPNPFYWSSKGYGVVRNTWKPGNYDFGSHDPQNTTTTHEGNDFDAFYFFDDSSTGILKDYYELTGKPALMPEYGFYEAHLNAYNRDYWVEVAEGTSGAVRFEDGKYYKEYQPGDVGNLKGTLESLNGEKDNYQFSARAVIDRYKKNDMPLGWFLPNDGYGAGYGQTNSLDGDVQNLKEFTDYAQANGVEVGLWTQSNLHPADPKNPKKGERDIEKEVGVAGVKALKTDVAWVGNGYSFGLNGVEDAANVFVKETDGAVRPMIVSLDGWAGTQRHAGIWTGDQTGGQWEYIRFHIPTYIGTSLSGQPNVGSDMDGIFGGKNKDVNIRDFQWKTFTPVQLNMDGWGSNPKTPFAFDQETTDLNRAYLKLKAMMMPYNYSIANESVNGAPMIRAMALEFPNEGAAYTKDSQYQYMWGPNLLVAPIYNGNQDAEGNSVRDGIYLPDSKQVWVDLFTGEKHQGGRVLNGVKTPLWKVPVYVKDGAIIPMTNANNNPSEIKRDQRSFLLYPNGNTSFDMYEDDGISTAYEKGQSASTAITSNGPKSNEKGELTVSVAPTKGNYTGFVAERSTRFDIMASEAPETVSVTVGNQKVNLTKATSKADFEKGTNMYYFDQEFQVNSYLAEATKEKLTQSALSIKVDKQNVTNTDVQVTVTGFINKGTVAGGNTSEDDQLAIPENVKIDEAKTTASALTVQWDQVANATSYEVERDGTVFGNITEPTVTFDGFAFLTEHQFRVRAVGENGVSKWSELITGTTKDDPYKNTIANVSTKSNLPEQPGEELAKLTDKDLSSGWHTNWTTGIADPANGNYLTLNFDLGAEYQMDKIEYLPRENAGNGNILNLQYRTSKDGITWSDYSEPITWKQDALTKTIDTANQTYRFVEMKVLKSVGNFGSGREMLFYKKEGTEGILLGDITNDGVIDENDAMSYRNYTGLESSDSDFNGYVEKGDLNKNGVIDSYDIHYVLRQLSGGIEQPNLDPIKGSFSLAVQNQDKKATYLQGDTLSLTLKGQELVNINALSARLNFDSTKFELVGQPATTEATKQMENYSKYRKHSNDVENLYLVLSNQGNKPLLTGSMDLVTFKLKVKAPVTRAAVEQLQFDVSQGLLVGQGLQQVELPDFSVTVDPTTSVDKTDLQELVALNQLRVESDYTPETWAPFSEALEEAIATLAKDEVTQPEIDQAITKLQTAVDGLEKVPNSVDKSALEQVLKEAIAKKPSEGNEFTEASKLVFEQGKKQAETVFADKQATQAEVDDATKQLTAAIAQLEEQLISVDKTELHQFIEKAKNEKPKEGYQFSEASKKVLADALAAAEKIAADPAATEAAVAQAVSELQAAINGLVEEPVVDKSELTAILTEVKTLKPADGNRFTPATLAVLQKAILTAEKVLNDSLANQVTVDEAVKEVRSAIDNLKEEPLNTDKSALEKVIKQAEGVTPSKGHEFTPATKAVLAEAIKAAQLVLADVNATQAEVDAAIKAVTTALDGLQEQPLPTVDKAQLKRLIEQAEALKPSANQQFTKETKATLEAALKAAKAILADDSASQAAVNQSIQDLEQAIKDLKEEAVTTNNGASSTPGNGSSGNVQSGKSGTTSSSLPKANEKQNPLVAIGGMVLVLGAFVIKFLFKNKKGQN